jgi:phospholipid/cholesterol/gamma-HCH transport system substrate-binding protein
MLTMISRIARVQVLSFLAAGMVGVIFVAVNYLGLGDRLLGRDYVVHADLATAGGLYPNAPVTYRGAPIGQVEAIRLQAGLVRADLRLRRDVAIPASLHAVVAERSAVGEQYLDLRPDADTGPYLRDGDVIPVSRTGTPLPVETLLANLDRLVHSVDPSQLTVVIDELGIAFETDETALRQILDATSALLNGAKVYLPQTLQLIQDSRIVLSTQDASANAIRQWADGLAKLTAAVRGADQDLRRLLTAAPPAAMQLMGLLRDLDPTIGTLLGNLVTVNGIAARRLPGIQQILVAYPIVVSGGFTVVPGDGTAHFGLAVNQADPPCQYRQTGQSGCTSTERANGSGARSNATAPRPAGPDPAPAPLGGPAPTGSAAGSSGGAPGSGGAAPAGTSVASYDPGTGLVVGPDGLPLEFGGTGGQYQIAGDQSWKQLLLSGLAP